MTERPASTLRDLLHEYDRSQAELAVLIGSRSHASEYLTGKRTMSLSHRKLLHKEWGVCAERLLSLPHTATDQSNRPKPRG